MSLHCLERFIYDIKEKVEHLTVHYGTVRPKIHDAAVFGYFVWIISDLSYEFTEFSPAESEMATCLLNKKAFLTEWPEMKVLILIQVEPRLRSIGVISPCVLTPQIEAIG
jgi:hypothetical protein